MYTSVCNDNTHQAHGGVRRPSLFLEHDKTDINTMRQIITNYRNWTLLAVLLVATLALIAVPAEGTPIAKWLLLLVGSKLLALACVLLLCSLYRRWDSQDKLGGLDSWLNDEV